MRQAPKDFLWGAATAPHQVEGNNVNSDWWAREGMMPGMDISGDACDSYHRYPEDMRLLAEAGLTSYRFGIEWARIEPRPGQIARSELAHYRRMIDTAVSFGLEPVVTLHHFTTPQWFAEAGAWFAPDALDRFDRYVATATEILDGVNWVVTMNEPNMLAVMLTYGKQMMARAEAAQWQSPTTNDPEMPEGLPVPEVEIGQLFVEAHQRVRETVRSRTGAKVGWTIANQAFTAQPENSARLVEVRYAWEDLYLEASREDDFVGVQAYSSQEVGPDGPIPHPADPTNTLVGTAYRPDSLGMAVRHTWDVTQGTPILVTENGIATDDDERRIAYTRDALQGLLSAMEDGVDVRGYLHWSALDNYEWGHWEPTFGLIAVDRETFERAPKPSLAWLGSVARNRGLEA
jgi:beta-glucosidase